MIASPRPRQSAAFNQETGTAWYCPQHQRRLADKGDELECELGDTYLRENGIPRFVPRETYADSFGAQGRKYRLTQLDSFSGTAVTAQRTRRCLGEELWASLAGKKVLECGCGAGRFTEVLLSR